MPHDQAGKDIQEGRIGRQPARRDHGAPRLRRDCRVQAGRRKVARDESRAAERSWVQPNGDAHVTSGASKAAHRFVASDRWPRPEEAEVPRGDRLDVVGRLVRSSRRRIGEQPRSDEHRVGAEKARDGMAQRAVDAGQVTGGPRGDGCPGGDPAQERGVPSPKRPSPRPGEVSSTLHLLASPPPNGDLARSDSPTMHLLATPPHTRGLARSCSPHHASPCHPAPHPRPGEVVQHPPPGA